MKFYPNKLNILGAIVEMEFSKITQYGNNLGLVKLSLLFLFVKQNIFRL